MNIPLPIKRLLFILTHPEWHRLDRHKPKYHLSCDVVEIQYGGKEFGATYETSLLSNVSYEGFICEEGLFVSTPSNTYWRPSEIVVDHAETLAVYNSKTKYHHYRWGP